jgi:translation elongation factor EF-Tu-like GTPase
MDKEIPIPEREINKPLLLSIEGTYHIGVIYLFMIVYRAEEL